MSGLVYHQRKLKVNTLQIGNQKKKLITRKKNLFRINLSAWFNLQNENLVRTRFIKSETWIHWYGGGGGRGGGRGREGGREGGGIYSWFAACNIMQIWNHIFSTWNNNWLNEILWGF